MSGFVFVGKVHSAQGIKGEIFVSIYSGEAEWADEWETLFLSDDKTEAPTQELKILKIREHQKQGRWGFSLNLESITDRNKAEELKGQKVYIPESFLVSDEGEEIYLREVLGFRVIDQTRGDVGVVVGFSGSALQDLLVVKGEEGQFEVPFVDPIHISTDKDKKQLQMDIPQGLVAGEEL